MKKILLTLFALSVFLLVPMLANAEDAYDISNMTPAYNYPNATLQDYYITKYNAAEKISLDYSFSPRFNSKKTTVTAFGKSFAPEDNLIGFKLTNNTVNNFGVIYKNVGTYKEQIIDMKVTITGCENTFSAPAIPLSERIIAFNKGKLSLYQDGFSKVDFTITFLIHNTNTPISVKGYITESDIDGKQGVYIQRSDIQKMFISKNSKLLYKAIGTTAFFYEPDNYNAGTNDIGPEEGYLFTYTFSGSTLKKSFLKNKNAAGNGGYVILNFTGFSNAPIDQPDPVKTIEYKNKSSKKTLIDNKYEPFIYNISAYVPHQAPTYEYTKFEISDQLLPIFDVLSTKIYNYDGDDVTKLFTITNTNNLITAAAKNPDSASLYNNEYNLKIEVRIKKGTTLTPHDENNIYKFLNTSTIKTNYETRTSNTTTTTLEKPGLEIIKEVDKKVFVIGEKASYKVVVNQTNSKSAAFDVIIKDVIPEGLSLDPTSLKVEGVVDPKIEINGNSYTIEIAKLEYGKPVTITYQVDTEVVGKEFKNIATTSAEEIDEIETFAEIKVENIENPNTGTFISFILLAVASIGAIVMNIYIGKNQKMYKI